MSFHDKRIEARPASGAAPFELSEVFFSRTDDRGVIQSGNYVFKRVSNFEWDDLLGAPHKIIRHPDMPAGVFQLFWDTLKSGHTIGAYVKNRAQDGLHYWVFAVAMPVEGGYLSARIKPSSALFEEIQTYYGELRQMELENGFSPEESRDFMVEWVKEKGFENYDDFAAHALTEELMARDIGLGQKPDPDIAELKTKITSADQLLEETYGLVKDFEAMHTIPHNLRVIASRIEPSGGPVTVLSQNYGAMSREMSDWFERNVMGESTNFATIKKSLHTGLMVNGLTRILRECTSHLEQERRQLGHMDLEEEQSLLKGVLKHQINRSERGMSEVDNEAQRIMSACQVMHRHFLGLSSTRVLCKIESARLPSSGETLADIIDQLGAFQERISHRLDHIARLGEEIRAHDERDE